MGTTKVKLNGCYPEKFCLLVSLYKCCSAWVGIGGSSPFSPWYLRILLTLLATSKDFLCVANSLNLFLRQHIGINGSRFERLVSHQFLGGLNVGCYRLYQYSESMSGAVKRDILINTNLLDYPFECSVHISLGRKMKDKIVIALRRHPRQGSSADGYGIESLCFLLDDYKSVRFLVPLDVAPS